MEYIGEWMLHDMDEVTSTNDEVLKLTQNIIGEKVIISARNQTNGRGRRGRDWISLEGNLFFSLGFECDFKDLGAMVFISSLGIWRTIQDLNPLLDVQLKWPNDVLVNGRKICGMLLEKGEGHYLIVGIGVNIKAAPLLVSTIYPCTSLLDAGIDVDRKSFLRSFIGNFDNYVNMWKSQGFAPIRDEWLAHVKGLGQAIVVRTDNSDEEGIFKGVDDHGSLLMETAGGIKNIYAGDVFYPQRNIVVNE